MIASAVERRCGDLGLGSPKLVVEPGRAIVGRAGVALYSVGSVKDIPGVRKYVSVDGGMGDNIRPALYDAAYEAVVANRMSDPPAETVTLAGKFCESGRRADPRHRDAGAGARRPWWRYPPRVPMRRPWRATTT